MLLGIDIGTSACKTAVFDRNGKVLAEASEAYPIYYSNGGWAEQNPEEWFSAVVRAMQKISKRIDTKTIRAVGVSGQSWSCIPVDKDGNVLHNTPIWFDTRSKKQCDELIKKIGKENIYNLCKNPVEPSYTTPKILWFKENCPGVYENAVQFLQSNSYIVYKLTGNFSQDKSQGFAHFCYDMEHGCYDAQVTKEMGIDINKLPPICECCDIAGVVTAEAEKQTGIPAGIPVAAGGLDAACGALGAGVISSGQTHEQGGQAGGMSICEDLPIAEKNLILGNHVIPGKWLLQGGTVAGGAALEWFAGEFKESFGEENTFKEIDKLADKIPAGSDGLIFLPYLNGERSPIWDVNAKGVFFGITFSKTKAHFARSVMEGAAFALRHNLDTAIGSGAKIDTLYSVGGSCNSDLWMQIKADITGKHIVVPESDNASTMGAAIVAGVSAKIYKNFEEAVNQTVVIKNEYYPNTENSFVYNKNYKKYLKIYRNLKEVMAE